MAAPKSVAARLTARRRKIAKWMRGATCKRLTHRTLPLVTIFVVVAYISYGHGVLYGLMAEETLENARLLPILYDALMVASIGYMSARHPVARYAAYAAFGYGFAMTLTANILASASTVLGKVVGTSVGVGLGIVALMLHFGSKPAPKRRPAARKAAVPAVKPVPVGVPALGDPYRLAPGLHAVAEPAYR